ncbi:MAG: TrkH family potassium uptake protein [Brevinematia bacterium]
MKDLYRVLKFFFLLANLIILLWIIFFNRQDDFLIYFVLLSSIFFSLADIILSYIEGLSTRNFYFSIMSFVTFILFIFICIIGEKFLFKNELKILTIKVSFITIILMLIVVFLYFIRSFNIGKIFKTRINFKPYAIISMSFLLLILSGSILLFLPFSHIKPISYLDALFTATSAVCVTGLTVFDVKSTLTLFGQMVLIVLVQLGGLGLMVFTALFSYLIGEKLSVFERITAQNALSADNLSIIYRFTSFIVLITLFFEVTGAIVFFLRFKNIFPVYEAIYYSIFHSISAFCNAGFSLFPDSFMGFRSDIMINLNLMSLIVIGGIGFSVLYNFYNLLLGRDKNLTLHTKLVLTTTALLILSGAFVIFLFEYDNQLKNSGLVEKVLASLFASITPRTAGFNTIDYSMVKHATLLFTCILMFIGASPGSTGGGIKTTSFALIVMNTISVLRDKKLVTAFRREISFDSIRKSLVVYFLSLTLVITQTLFILSIQPDFGLARVLFEVVSAFGTVGLSTGITPDLSALSKVLIITTMFLGRVGTVTVIFSLGLNPKQVLSRTPEEKVITG